METKFTVTMIVDNEVGVLNRISGLYAKRGFNINSLVVFETEDPKYSKMTIVSFGDEDMQKQVYRQLQKIYSVKFLELLPEKQASSAV